MRSLKYAAIRAAKVVGLVVAVLALLLANASISVLTSFWLWMGYVRQCANYRPKGVALGGDDDDDEASASPKLGPDVPGVFAMITRTRKLEGWRGLYQGTTLAIAMNYLLAVVSLLVVVGIVLLSSHVHVAPAAAGWLYAAFVVVSWVGPVVLTLPLEVLLLRTMVYPHRLNWLEPRRAVRAVLTRDELAKPWRLYALPGVFVSMLVRDLLTNVFQMTPSVVMTSYRTDWAQVLLGAPERVAQVTAVRVALVVAWSLLTVVCTVPVYVVSVRLMTQRAAPYAVSGSDAPDTFMPRTVDPTAEPVISLRPCTEPLNEAESFYGAATVAPYRGIVDCVRKMVVEEGYESLARGVHFAALLVFWMNLGRMEQFAHVG